MRISEKRITLGKQIKLLKIEIAEESKYKTIQDPRSHYFMQSFTGDMVKVWENEYLISTIQRRLKRISRS